MGLLDEAIREHLELKRLRGADPAEVARMEREALGPARRPDSEDEPAASAEPGAAAPFDADLGEAAGISEAGAPSDAGAFDDAGLRTMAAAEGPAGHGAPEVEHDAPEPDLESPPPDVYDDEQHAPPVGASEPGDRSIAPASYGQETAEFDVESAVLGQEPAPRTPSGSDADVDAGTAPGPHAADISPESPLAPHAPDEPGPYEEMAAAEPGHEPAGELPAAPSEDPEAAAGEPPAYVEEPTQLHPEAAPPPAEPEHPRPAPARGQGEPGAEGEPEEDVLEETPDFLQETPEHERLWFEQRPPRDFDFDK